MLTVKDVEEDEEEGLECERRKRGINRKATPTRTSLLN